MQEEETLEEQNNQNCNGKQLSMSLKKKVSSGSYFQSKLLRGTAREKANNKGEE